MNLPRRAAILLLLLGLPLFAEGAIAESAGKGGSAPVIRPFPAERIIQDGTLIYEVTLVTRGPDGLEAKLKLLSPKLRRLALLSLIWHGWGRDGLHTFFYLGDASVAPEILEALREPGFAKQRRVFAKAMALFGPIYPRVEYLRSTFFAQSKGDGPSPFDSEFDKKLYALGTAFGSKAEYGKALVSMVAHSRELSAWAAQVRKKISDETRLAWLTEQLEIALGANARLDETRRRLAGWPDAHRIIYLLDVFNSEMLNGGVDQYFYNSSGELAPETVIALREAGLMKHAAVLENCIGMFGSPYPADTEFRREGWFHDAKGLLAKLRSAAFERATGRVDDGKIEYAMIDLAKRAGIWPK